MAKNLVIVESPAKAGTIGKYLGPDYEVMASMGHVRDLPTSKIGVDTEAGYVPTYVVPLKAKKTVTALKSALKGKEKVLLATDLDREGEAIAWHVAQALGLDGNKAVKVERITFDEITKTAIQYAVAHPRQIDQQLVDAQQARRVLDRLVGYTLSPILWRKIYKGLSAGRVQSVALRLIIDRERERLAFNPVEYWSVKANLAKKQGKHEAFTANLVEYESKKVEQLTISGEAQARAIETALEKTSYVIRSLDRKQVARHPSAPYTTSTLQQDAVNKLSMSSKRVMQLAQRLYEAGHITYMRTDSVAFASIAVDAIRDYVGGAFGPDYIPAKPNFYKSKAKNAQEAHEAIRPTDPTRLAESISAEPAGQKLYDLIRRRALASQMSEAKLEQSTVTIDAVPGVFRASGQRILFPGFLSIYGIEDKEENILPELTEKESLDLKELLPEQHFTEPPPRFTEASLIKVLEEQGIGRPSTYAPTIDTLVQRRYVTLDQRRFAPEPVGFLVIDLLVEHFPRIVDLGFTAAMEEELDRIATGEENYVQILDNFWKPFSLLIAENTEKIVKVNTDEETDVVCPNCGKPMVIKMGRFGKFLACTGFPDCKTTQPINQAQPTGLICPICGKPVIEKRARRGIFFGCSGFPDCTFALWKKEYLPSKIEELEKEGQAVLHKDESLRTFQETGLSPLTPRPRVAKSDDTKAKPKARSKKRATKKAAPKKP